VPELRVLKVTGTMGFENTFKSDIIKLRKDNFSPY